MILIGQYDSPFVRRVAIALTLYELPFEQRPLSVWANADELSTSNPLRRVPTLVLDDGEGLIESYAILDALDEMVGPERALIAASGVVRRRALGICALATGAADKAVSLFYETLLHPEPAVVWVERCRRQIEDTLALLERERGKVQSAWWFGERLGHADIAVSCMLRFLREAHPGSFNFSVFPRLSEHAERSEALPVFQTIVQPFSVAISR
ncbi:MAG: glutathione S-transferase family protein [Myxococcota bacterium]